MDTVVKIATIYFSQKVKTMSNAFNNLQPTNLTNLKTC